MGRAHAAEPPVRSVARTPLQTERSQTTRNADGTFTTTIFSSPVNYRDRTGQWRAIDNDLLPTVNGALVNTAGALDVTIPAHAAGPVTVADGGHSVSFSLAAGAEASEAEAEGSEARFEDALPGVDATYEVDGAAVKETLTLATADAPTSYVFDVDAEGLTPSLANSGDVAFRDAGGTIRFSFAAPWMRDAAGEVSRDVSYELRGSGPTQQVVLRVDQRWLSAPERRFPVDVDPTVWSNPLGVCEIAGGTSANSYRCGSSMPVWVGRESSKPHRALVALDDLAEVAPDDALVLRASLDAIFVGQSTDASSDVDVHHLTRGFTSRATWNRTDGRALWTTPGGDYAPVREARRTLVPAHVEDWISWDITELAQQLLAGDDVSPNLLVKAADESLSHHDVLDSFTVKITYAVRTGIGPIYTYDQWSLSDGSLLRLNVGNPNFTVSRNDLDFQGDDGRFAVSRVYNSENRYEAATFGYGTRGDFGSISLEWNWLDGSYMLRGAGAFDGVFHKRIDGSFVAPPGMNVTLTELPDGSATMAFLDTGAAWTFAYGNPLKHLVRTREQDGYQVDATYTAGGDRLATLSDSQGNSAVFSYDSAGDLRTITDHTRAVHRYAYVGHTLTTYTSPTGAQTRYTYDDRLLTSISLPDRTALELDYWPGTSFVRWVTPLDAAGVEQPATLYDGGTGYTTAQRPGADQVAWFYDTRLRVDLTQVGRAPALTVSGNVPARSGTYDRALVPYTIDASSADVPDGVRQLVLDVNGQPIDSFAGDCTVECPRRLRATLLFDASTEPDGAYAFQVRALDDDLDSRSSDSFVINVDRAEPSAPTDIEFLGYDVDVPTEAFFTWDSGQDPAAPDTTPGAGVVTDEFRYRLAGGAWTAWTAAADEQQGLITGATTGTIADVEVRSVDAVGNASAPATASLTLTEDSADPFFQQISDTEMQSLKAEAQQEEPQLRDDDRTVPCEFDVAQPGLAGFGSETGVLIHDAMSLTCDRTWRFSDGNSRSLQYMKITVCLQMRGGEHNTHHDQVCLTQRGAATGSDRTEFRTADPDMYCRAGTRVYRTRVIMFARYEGPVGRERRSARIKRGTEVELTCNDAGAFRAASRYTPPWNSRTNRGGWKRRMGADRVRPSVALASELEAAGSPRPNGPRNGWHAHHIVAVGFLSRGGPDVQAAAYRCNVRGNSSENGVWLRGPGLKFPPESLDDDLARRAYHPEIHTTRYFTVLRSRFQALGSSCTQRDSFELLNTARNQLLDNIFPFRPGISPEDDDDTILED